MDFEFKDTISNILNSFQLPRKGQNANTFFNFDISGGKESFKDVPNVISLFKSYLEFCEDNPIEIEEVAGKDAKIVNLNKKRVATVEGFCNYIGISLVAFVKYSKSEQFKDVCEAIRNAIFSHAFEHASAGSLSANLIGRYLNIAEKKEITANVNQKVILYVPTPNENVEDISYEEVRRLQSGENAQNGININDL